MNQLERSKILARPMSRNAGLRSNFIWNDHIFDSLKVAQTQRMEAIANLDDFVSVDAQAISAAEQELTQNNIKAGPFTGAYLANAETAADEGPSVQHGGGPASIPGVRFLDDNEEKYVTSRYRFPRTLADIFVIIGWIGVIVGAVVVFIPPFIQGIVLIGYALFQILLCYIAKAVFDIADQTFEKREADSAG